MNTNEYTPVTLNDNSTLKINTRRPLFTGNKPHEISLQDAALLTKRFRDTVSEDAIKGGFFARNAFERTLAQEGCVGIRCYFAAFDDGSPTIVIVGVNRHGNDIWNGSLSEEWIPCPPKCPTKNALNSNISIHASVFDNKEKMFTGKENHRVTLAEAKHYTRNFRSNAEWGAVVSSFSGKHVIEEILAQEHCVGIRLYFASREDNLPTLVLVGVKENGCDMIDGIITENWVTLPTENIDSNPLNA